MKLVKKTEQKVIESGDGRKATQTSEREEKQKRKMRERQNKFNKLTLCSRGPVVQ